MCAAQHLRIDVHLQCGQATLHLDLAFLQAQRFRAVGLCRQARQCGLPLHRRVALLEATLPLRMHVCRTTGLPALQPLGPDRPALEPGHAHGGIADVELDVALTLLWGKQAFGLGLQAGRLPLQLALRRLLRGLVTELPLQAGVSGLHVQRLDVPQRGLPKALQMQSLPLQASPCLRAAVGGQVGLHGHGASVDRLGLDLAIQGTACQGGVQLIGLDARDADPPRPAGRGLLAFALNLAFGDVRLQRLDLPKPVGLPLQLGRQLAQGEGLAVPRTGALVFQIGQDLPCGALRRDGRLARQARLGCPRPKGRQVQLLHPGAGLIDRLFLPWLNARLHLQAHACFAGGRLQFGAQRQSGICACQRALR